MKLTLKCDANCESAAQYCVGVYGGADGGFPPYVWCAKHTWDYAEKFGRSGNISTASTTQQKKEKR